MSLQQLTILHHFLASNVLFAQPIRHLLDTPNTPVKIEHFASTCTADIIGKLFTFCWKIDVSMIYFHSMNYETKMIFPQIS